MQTQKIYINNFALSAPGLIPAEQTAQTHAVLTGKSKWTGEETLPNLPLNILPANERRRATPLMKLALSTIQTIFKTTDNLDETAAVFASSHGDLDITHKINTTLTHVEKHVSPTQFHNSVHNAVAGYWMMAQSIQAASVSLSAGDATFSAGLIEAITQTIINQQTVLFVAYDSVSPPLLNTNCSVTHSLAIALRLGLKKEADNVGHITLSISDKKQALSPCQNTSLQPLYTGNPNGVGLPLLETLASGNAQTIVLPYMAEQRVIIDVNS